MIVVVYNGGRVARTGVPSTGIRQYEKSVSIDGLLASVVELFGCSRLVRFAVDCFKNIMSEQPWLWNVSDQWWTNSDLARKSSCEATVVREQWWDKNNLERISRWSWWQKASWQQNRWYTTWSNSDDVDRVSSLVLNSTRLVFTLEVALLCNVPLLTIPLS